jgi:hypothetical protein
MVCLKHTCSVLVIPRNISVKWIERGAGLSTVVKEINDFPLPGSKPRPNWLSQVALRHYVSFCIWSSLSRYPSTVGWWCTLLWKYALTWKEHQYIQRWIKIWKQTCNISILIRSADLHIIQYVIINPSTEAPHRTWLSFLNKNCIFLPDLPQHQLNCCSKIVKCLFNVQQEF